MVENHNPQVNPGKKIPYKKDGIDLWIMDDCAALSPNITNPRNNLWEVEQVSIQIGNEYAGGTCFTACFFIDLHLLMVIENYKNDKKYCII